MAGPDGATGPNEAAGREHYRTVVETVPVGLLLVDERAGIDWFNDRFARLFEEDESELLDLSVPDLIDRGYLEPSLVERYLDGVREMLSDDATADRLVEDVVVHGPDGEDRWFDVHWGLRPTEDGEFRGTVVVFREITDRKTSERALRRQNRRLEQIASFASHDLRNPLTVARGYAERALSAAAPDGEAHAAAEEVVTSLDRMDRLIDQMLTLARGEARPTDVTEVDLAAVAREAWADATGTGGPTGPDDPVVGAPVRADAGDGPVEATLTVEDCVVTGDRSLVRQALVNLFRNAIQHGATTGDPGDRPDGGDGREASDGSGGDQGGEASDGGGEDDGDDQDDGDGEAIPSVSVRVGPLGDGEGFYVADDGPGIQPVERELVFELGYTTTETGTGFGLGIVRQVAEAHGWAVRVTESAAGGARFEVSATG